MKMRSRIIRPGFFLNEHLAELKDKTRLYFIGLWLLADRDGKLEYRPKKIKALLFPYESADIENMSSNLKEKDFIIIYKIDSVSYIKINNFTTHQSIHHNETESLIPEPQEDSLDDSTKTLAGVLIEPTKSLETSRLVGNGKGISSGSGKGKSDEIPFQDIFNHLNKTIDSNYQHTTESYRKLIRLRWDEGFRFDDFKYVHAVKAEEWLMTDKSKYLRPETLYGNKFQGYRNQKPANNQIPEQQRKNVIATHNWEPPGENDEIF